MGLLAFATAAGASTCQQINAMMEGAWLSLAAVALCSSLFGHLRALSLHGKLLVPHGGNTNNNTNNNTLMPMVPKQWFTHFYVCGVGALLVIAYDAVVGGGELLLNPLLRHSGCADDGEAGEVLVRRGDGQGRGLGRAHLLAAMMIIHTSRRLYECLCIHVFGDSIMSLTAYGVGLLHYLLAAFTLAMGFATTPLPLTPQLPDSSIEGGGGGVPPTWTSACLAVLSMLWSSTGGALQVGGVILFVFASTVQHLAHRHLASLRQRKRGGGGREGAAAGASGQQQQQQQQEQERYGIPYAGLFSLVSCPNMLAEALVYVSYLAVASPSGASVGVGTDVDAGVAQQQQLVIQPQMRGVAAMCVWVCANQAVGAARTHRWYVERFGETYPRHRKRMIPFVW